MILPVVPEPADIEEAAVIHGFVRIHAQRPVDDLQCAVVAVCVGTLGKLDPVGGVMTVAADGPSSLPVLYLMAPMTLYGSPVLTVAREYPFAALTGCEVELVCAEDLFCCNRCWIAAWPELRARIKYGVFLDHLGGFAGRGTFAEVMELLALGRPVWWYRDGEPTDSFRFGAADYRDWGGRYRQVMAVPKDAPARR